jgi:hypothetical protein
MNQNAQNHNAWMKTRVQEQAEMKPWLLPVTDTRAERLGKLVNGFSPIGLQEMDSVALLDRIDTKYVLRIEQLLQALAGIQADYQILSVDGQRLNHYRTLYFDTQNFSLYHLHVNERADRFKVRSREYLDSQLSFLEVKHHTPKDRTIKSRVSTFQPALWINAGAERWLKDVFPYDSRELEPKLWNTFTRITLVNRVHCERVTIDLDLAFYTAHRFVGLDGIVVAEVKQDGHACTSAFQRKMRELRIRPQGFSKYCIGTSLMYEQVKKNSLKAKLLWLEKNSIGVNHE